MRTLPLVLSFQPARAAARGTGSVVLPRHQVTAMPGGHVPKRSSYGTAGPEAPPGLYSPAVVLSSAGERRETRDLHFKELFSCKVLPLHCLVTPTLYFPTKWAFETSVHENTGKQIPYRQDTEGAGPSSLLLSRMEGRPPQIPSYLIPCSNFCGMPGSSLHAGSLLELLAWCSWMCFRKVIA